MEYVPYHAKDLNHITEYDLQMYLKETYAIREWVQAHPNEDVDWANNRLNEIKGIAQAHLDKLDELVLNSRKRKLRLVK